MMKTPVLILVYNRPSLVEEQLAVISKQPLVGTIYIAGDGAKNNELDRAKVSAVRKVIENYAQAQPSRYRVRFSRSNQGCQCGVEQGIDWFFEHEESGIILEDDCRPDDSFFEYCSQLLEKYRDDSRVGMISGTNPVTNHPVKDSYFFSHHSMIWGWATWRRAWQDYHVIKRSAPKLLKETRVQDELLKTISPKQLKTIHKVLSGEIDTWDYIWYLTNLLQSRYCILPRTNLISNVGFAVDATHTKFKTTQSRLPVQSIRFPLRHPGIMIANAEFERWYITQQRTDQVVLSILLAYGREFWQKLGAGK